MAIISPTIIDGNKKAEAACWLPHTRPAVMNVITSNRSVLFVVPEIVITPPALSVPERVNTSPFNAGLPDLSITYLLFLFFPIFLRNQFLMLNCALYLCLHSLFGSSFIKSFNHLGAFITLPENSKPNITGICGPY